MTFEADETVSLADSRSDQFSGPDFVLVWPPGLLAAELEALSSSTGYEIADLRRLLGEAFAGDAILDRLHAGEWADEPLLNGRSSNAVSTLIQQLVTAARAGQLRSTKDRPPRWRRRNDALNENREKSEPRSHRVQLRVDFKQALTEMDNHGYFDREAPRPCVDGDYDDDEVILLDVVNREFGDELALGFLAHHYSQSNATIPTDAPDWSPPPSIADLDDDDLYELIEIFHDLAARPRKAFYHEFSGCGMHYTSFAIEPGQALYRWRINRVLRTNSVPLELGGKGELEGRLVLRTDESRSELVHTVVENANRSDQKTLEHALTLFRKRAATRDDKRSAIVALAGLLEQNRKLLKSKLHSKDEGALFNIANNFDLRHRNSGQAASYDDAFFDWFFWWYLATIELFQRMAPETGPAK